MKLIEKEMGLGSYTKVIFEPTDLPIKLRKELIRFIKEKTNDRIECCDVQIIYDGWVNSIKVVEK